MSPARVTFPAGAGRTDRETRIPIDYAIDREARLVVVTSFGEVSEAEMLERLAAALRDPDRERGMNVLLDVRAQRTIPSPELIRSYVERLAASGRLTTDTRYAVVASEDALFGMARVFAARSAGLPGDVRAFRSLEEARTWLGADRGTRDAAGPGIGRDPGDGSCGEEPPAAGGPPPRRLLSVLARTLVFTVLVPGTVAIYFPHAIVSRAGTLARIDLPWAVRLAGAVLAALGAALYVWCAWDFARYGLGTPAPIDAPRRLVVRGPYRLVRNPMYLAVLCVLLGEVLWTGILALAAYALVVGLVFHTFVVGYEEPTLRRRFGAGYARYQQAVPRWIPRRRPGEGSIGAC